MPHPYSRMYWRSPRFLDSLVLGWLHWNWTLSAWEIILVKERCRVYYKSGLLRASCSSGGAVVIKITCLFFWSFLAVLDGSSGCFLSSFCKMFLATLLAAAFCWRTLALALSILNLFEFEVFRVSWLEWKEWTELSLLTT